MLFLLSKKKIGFCNLGILAKGEVPNINPSFNKFGLGPQIEV